MDIVGANQSWTPSYAAHLGGRSKDLSGVRYHADSTEMSLLCIKRAYSHTRIHINTKYVLLISLSFSHNTINICLHITCAPLPSNRYIRKQGKVVNQCCQCQGNSQEVVKERGKKAQSSTNYHHLHTTCPHQMRRMSHFIWGPTWWPPPVMDNERWGKNERSVPRT